LKLKPLRTLHQAAHHDGVLTRWHKHHIAIAELNEGHGAVEHEVIQAGGGTHLPCPLDLHINERATIWIDTTRLVKEVQQAVHTGAVV
jgi:hypothetical protein